MFLICRLAFAGLAVVVPAGDVATAPGGDDRPVVLTTTSIWADLVDRLDCADQFAVDALMMPKPVVKAPLVRKIRFVSRDAISTFATSAKRIK